MKIKNITLLIILLFTACMTAQSQYRRVNYFPDSIRVEFPEQKMLVIFEVRRFGNDFGFIENFNETITALATYTKRALPGDISALASRRIDVHIKPETEKLMLSTSASTIYKPEGERTEITIREPDPETNLLIQEKTITQLLPPGWEVYITGKDVKVTIYAETFEGIEQLGKQDFKSVVAALKADPKMNSIGKKRIQSRMIIQQGAIAQKSINYIYPGDLIFLTGHAGVGLLRDKFYPELTASLGLYFTDHFNRRNHRLELIFNNMFFGERKTEGGFSTNVNSFLSLAYSKNFGRGEQSSWTSLGAGLLVNKNGDYFKGKTAKIFFSSGIGNTNLNLVPEFYLTNDFKTFAFGMKLNYTF